MFKIKSFILIIIIFISGITLSAESKVYHWNKGRGYKPFRHATEKGISLNNESAADLVETFNMEEPSSEIRLTFRVDNLHGAPSKRYPYVERDGIIRKKKDPEWGFFIFNEKGDTIFFNIGRGEKETMLETASHLIIRINYPHGLREEEILTTEPGTMETNSGINQWSLELNKDMISLWSGHRSLELINKASFPFGRMAGMGFVVGPAAHIIISDITLSVKERKAVFSSSYTTLEELEKYFSKTRDPYEGFWLMFDRTLEESLVKPGGEYLTAIVKNGRDYDIIYLGGSTINSDFWHPGMLKGRLLPTPFDDIFDAEWIDSEGEPLSKGVKVQYEDGETLNFQFPYQSSSFRLRKVEPNKLHLLPERRELDK